MRMNQSEARPLVLSLFREWAEANGHSLPINNDVAIEGYRWIAKEQREALEFLSGADKSVLIRIWLLKAGLMKP